MKRIVAIFSLIVVLISSSTVISSLSTSSESAISKYGAITNTPSKSFQFNASPLHITGIESLIFSSNTTLNIAVRLHANPLHAVNLRSFAALIHLRYIGHMKLCAHRASFIQHNGYYLYYLQKMLI